jgi:hypothetical protein
MGTTVSSPFNAVIFRVVEKYYHEDGGSKFF